MKEMNQVEDSKDFVCMPYKYFLPIDIFIGYWDYFMERLRKDEYGTHIVLNEEAYLLDAKKMIDEIIFCLPNSRSCASV